MRPCWSKEQRRNVKKPNQVYLKKSEVTKFLILLTVLSVVAYAIALIALILDLVYRFA